MSRETSGRLTGLRGDWSGISVSFDETHHVKNDQPLYDRRFNRVMSFHPPGVAAVEDESGAYHIDTDGLPIYPQRFLKAYGYYEGLAAVCDKSGWYHIDLSGSPSYKERYAWVGNFQEGCCPVRDFSGKYFHITLGGQRLYRESYAYVGDFRYGIAVVYDQSGYASHIDKSGKKIHDRKYVELGVFHKGVATARDERGSLHVDKSGQELYDTRFEWTEPFYNDYAFARDRVGNLVVVDKNGQTVHTVTDSGSEAVLELARRRLLRMMVGYWDTAVLYAIVRTNILEAIEDNINARQELAEHLRLPLISVNLLVRVMKLWSLVTETSGRLAVSPIGKLLTTRHPRSIRNAALMWGDEHYVVMHRLVDALRTGKPQFSSIFGQAFFDYVSSNPQYASVYTGAMAEYSIDYRNIGGCIDLGNAKIVADVGGGHGLLLVSLLRANPHLEKGILFDLPEIIEIAHADLASNPEYHRIEFVSGNFFERIDIRADVIVLSRVIHDWDDKHCIQILRNAAAALHANGRIVVVETVVEEEDEEGIGALASLNLLVMVGGRERTIAELESIARSAGLRIVETRKLNRLLSIFTLKRLVYED